MLENSRIKAGRWEAVSHEKEAPDLEVRHQGEVLEGLLLTGEPGDWHLSQPIPAELLSEGVLTFLVCRKSDGEVIDRFSLVAGAPLAGDLRAEIDLLRTELDMLSRAFRQLCAESES